MARTIDDVLRAVPSPAGFPELPAPPHVLGAGKFRFGLAVASMRDHMTSEGWELFKGLEAGGYDLWHVGAPPPRDNTNVPDILSMGRTFGGVSTVVLQDKREWEGRTAGGPKGFDARERFTGVEALKGCGAFVLTVLKDAQHDPAYNRAAAEEIGAHAWVVYYPPRVVKHLAPYVRERHLVRTYHSLDRDAVPPFSAGRPGKVLLSGALSRAYPLRARLAQAARAGQLWGTDVLRHPGYHRDGCETPEYLATLAGYRVAICTSSVYGYAVRKIMEATACGCRVVTDLPSDDVLPGIDSNLIRVRPDVSAAEMNAVLSAAYHEWDPYRQEKTAEIAKNLYDYRTLGQKLADDIEALRRGYNDGS